MTKYTSPAVSDVSSNFEIDNFVVQDFVDRLAADIPKHPYPKIELELLTGVVNWVKPSHILEWGTHFGVSALIFHKIIQEFGLKTKLVTIDIPPNIKHEEQPGENRAKYIKNIKEITQLLGDGVTTAIKYLANSKHVNDPLFFLDGDHKFESVQRELEIINTNYPQAYILLHDTFSQVTSSGYNNGPYAAIKEFLVNHPEYQFVHANMGLPGMTFLYPTTSKSPLVSVVIPVHNAAKYVQKSLKSILQQSYKNLEVIVINDGSTDNTREIIEQLNDKRINLINFRHNKGIVAALNAGLKIARGKYIARMDADDISALDRIQKQVVYMESHPRVGVCGTWIKVVGNKRYTWKPPTLSSDLKIKAFLESPIAHPSVIMRSRVIQEHQLYYDPKYEYAEDYKLWVDMMSYCELANIPETLLSYRIHPHQIGATKNVEQVKAVTKIKRILLSQLIDSPTQAQVDFHVRAMSWPKNLTLIELEQFRQWYENLVRANNNKQIYDINKFKSLIGERWVGACYLAKDLGIKRYIKILESRNLLYQALFYILKSKYISLLCYIRSAFGKH